MNLNPIQPERITNPTLGKTDIAKILLEAALKMLKQEGFILIDEYDDTLLLGYDPNDTLKKQFSLIFFPE